MLLRFISNLICIILLSKEFLCFRDIEDLQSVISEAQVRCSVRPVLGWTAEYCILCIICIHPVGAEAISKLRDVGRIAERALFILSE